jgi:flagellar biosynthesis regulator FlaF
MDHIEQDAQALTEAALEISRAVEGKNQEMLNAALQVNLGIWAGIRVVMGLPDSPIAAETRANLMQLSQYVVKTTHELSQDLRESAAESLVNINLQISEGLLESISRANDAATAAATPST